MVSFNRDHKGFTLVELLTVVAIIALLISIMVPVVSKARQQAKESAVRAQLHAIEVGLELFHTDFGFYPSSTPQDLSGNESHSSSSSYKVQGAHRLVFALLGRDKLGAPADPSKGPDSIDGVYYTSDGTFEGSRIDPGDAGWGDPYKKTPRRGPYINPDQFFIVEDKNVDSNGYVWLLCDKFNRKTSDITSASYDGYSFILYYAANRSGRFLTNQSSGGKPASTSDNDDQIYYYEDNYHITQAGYTDNDGNGSYSEADFFIFVNDERSKIGNYFMPHNKDTYLLIAPGADGQYFSSDDIVNW